MSDDLFRAALNFWRAATESSFKVSRLGPAKAQGILQAGDTKVEVTVTWEVLNTHEIEIPDPRTFGDPPGVVARAMLDWYPGRTEEYVVLRGKITIAATNLPGWPETSTAECQFDDSGGVPTLSQNSALALKDLILSEITF